MSRGAARLYSVLVMCAGCLAATSGRAQDGHPVAGVWSSTLTVGDSPAWKVADLLCEFCSLAEYRSFESLLADPANRERSLEELRDQSRRVGMQHIQQLYTEAARDRLARFRPPPDPSVQCDPPNLLGLVMGPLPIAIEIQGARAIFHFQDWNTVREVVIARGATSAGDDTGRAPSTTAHFEGETLVVESRNVPRIEGMATTDEARMTERWSPSADGSRLDVELTIDDADTFREPLVFFRGRLRTPDVQLVDYDPCEDLSRGPGERAP